MKLSRRALLAWAVGLGLSRFPLSGWGQEQERLLFNIDSSLQLEGVVDKALDQMRLAIQHTLLAAFSLTLSDLKLHACHVLNLVVSQGSPDYDPGCGEVGDGVGLMNYCQEIRRLIGDSEYQERWAWATENYLIWLEAAIPLLKRVKEVGEESEARKLMRQMLAFLKAIQGCEEDPPTEGGLRTLRRWLEDQKLGGV